MTLPRPADDQERRHVLRFTHPQRWPMLARFPVSPVLVDHLLAGMFAGEASAIHDLVEGQQHDVAATASRLMADPGYAADIGALPFGDGDRVVVVGDSVSADRLGWVEILDASLRLARGAAVSMVNQSISGDTTASAIERLDLLAAARPDHVLVMLGTNDARRHGLGGAARMVSAQETRRNLHLLIGLIGDLGAAAHVITPPACDHARIAGFFDGAPVSWLGDELDEVVELVRAIGPAVIDVAGAMTAVPPGEFPGLLEPDGIHPTAAGQQLLARHIAAALAT